MTGSGHSARSWSTACLCRLTKQDQNIKAYEVFASSPRINKAEDTEVTIRSLGNEGSYLGKLGTASMLRDAAEHQGGMVTVA